MRRTSLFRAFASVLSVWLAICLAEPMQLHTCVMHGGLAIDVSIQDAGMHAAAMAGGSTHAAHGGSTHAMAGHSHHDQGPDGQARQCTCLGDCNAGKTPVSLASAPTHLAALQVETQKAVFSYRSSPLVSPQFLLPFSNGPPSASSRA